jgi:hypothetical protein
MRLFADRDITPLADYSKIVFEVCGKGYRDKNTAAWCVPVWITVWTDDQKWKFWLWQVTEYISKKTMTN